MPNSYDHSDDPFSSPSGGKNVSLGLAGVQAINTSAGGKGNALDKGLDSAEGNLFGNQEHPGMLGGNITPNQLYDPNAGAFGGINSSGYFNQANLAANRPNDPVAQQQQAYIQMLQGQAAGTSGPTAAQAMLQQATDKNAASAIGMMASQRGPGAGAAGYQAATMGVAANQQAAAQGAALRAQEQQQAQQMLGGALGQTRGQDVQEQQLRDEMVRSYVAQGASIDQANREAQIKLEELRAKQSVEQEKIRTEDYKTAGENGVGGIVGGLVSKASDERLKENVESAAPDLYDFLDKLSGHSYDYKDEKYGQGKHVSVMAQELEKSDAGDPFVFEMPNGAGKAVDYGKGLGTMLASQAELHKRLKALEKKNGR